MAESKLTSPITMLKTKASYNVPTEVFKYSVC